MRPQKKSHGEGTFLYIYIHKRTSQLLDRSSPRADSVKIYVYIFELCVCTSDRCQDLIYKHCFPLESNADFSGFGVFFLSGGVSSERVCNHWGYPVYFVMNQFSR